MKTKKILLLLISFLCTLNLWAPIHEINIMKIAQEYNYEKLYNKVLTSIKSFEGLKLNTYLCPAGYKTIGYGHCIKPNEHISGSLTLAQADSILRADVDYAMMSILKLKKFDKYREPEKVLALTHFVFNMGCGNFNKSILKEKVLNNKHIETEMLRWVHYKDNNQNVVTSQNLIKMRHFEIDLFNSHTQTFNAQVNYC